MQNRIQLKELLCQFGYDKGMLDVMNKGCDGLSDSRFGDLLSSLQLAQESLPELLDITDGLIKECKVKAATQLSIVSSKSIEETEQLRNRRLTTKNRETKAKLAKSLVIQNEFSKQKPRLDIVIQNEPIEKDDFFDIYKRSCIESTFHLTKMYFDAWQRIIESFNRPYQILLDKNSEPVSESAKLQKNSNRSADKSMITKAAKSRGEMTPMAKSISDIANSVPPGSFAAVEAVRSAIAAASSAFDNMNKAAMQIAEITKANVAAAKAEKTALAAKKANGK